jgi:zinc D-Ala-D-Ala dipeptidase
MRRLLFVVLLFGSYVAAQPGAKPQFFHITPVRPVEELRKEALKAQPPVERRDFLKPDLVELVKIDPSIKLDIRYATNRNFLSTPVYEEARAFMQRPAAEAVARASQKLHEKGFGLMIYDAYRPWYVTKIFWDATPPENHKFVADPAEGSRHNRGCAVDLTMYDLKTGEAVPMTGLYDEMSERSYPNYKGGTEEERRNRETLRAAMEAEGFKVYDYEWWHFDFKGYEKYPILNLKFANIDSGTKAQSIQIVGGRVEDLPPELQERLKALGHEPRSYSIGADVTAPVPIETPAAEVPDWWNTDLTSSLSPPMLHVVIDENGRIVFARPLRSSGNGTCDRIATDQVFKTWKYRPGMRNGAPVAVQMDVEVSLRKP